jgi:hypothetical protein
MAFRGSHIRNHQRYAYLQFITFFSLGSQVAEGSRRAICVDLSDSGMCMYTPDRLRKGQAILFNDALPVQGPKAIVRWVKEYRMTGRFYKSGIMFSGHAEEDSVRSSRCEHGDLEDPSPGGAEKRSSVIENLNFAFPGGNYRVASSDDFWSNLTELSEKEADQFIALTSEVMLHETVRDDVSLRFLRAIAFFRKARIIFSRKGKHWDDRTLDLVEKSLIDFRAADEFAGSGERFPHTALEENRDAAAKAIEGARPGRAQEILGKTKLAYVGDRLYLRNRQYAPSDEEMAIFENIFFHYQGIVRSAEIFYKVLGEQGKRYINVLLYEETSPRNSGGEANDPLCIMGLVEDGTFHLVKDLVAGAVNAEVGEEVAEDSKPLYEEQPGQEARGMKTAWERTDREVYEDSDEKKRSAEAPGGVTSRAGVGRDRKKVKLLIACAILLLLMITLFFLKSYQPKSVSETKKELIQRPHPMATQETVGHPNLPSESPENRSSITREPKSSGKVKGHDSRGAPAVWVTGKKKKRSRKTEANAEGRIITNPGRTTGTPSPEIKKRSFTPHSRDDL